MAIFTDAIINLPKQIIFLSLLEMLLERPSYPFRARVNPMYLLYGKSVLYCVLKPLPCVEMESTRHGDTLCRVCLKPQPTAKVPHTANSFLCRVPPSPNTRQGLHTAKGTPAAGRGRPSAPQHMTKASTRQREIFAVCYGEAHGKGSNQAVCFGPLSCAIGKHTTDYYYFYIFRPSNFLTCLHTLWGIHYRIFTSIYFHNHYQ